MHEGHHSLRCWRVPRRRLLEHAVYRLSRGFAKSDVIPVQRSHRPRRAASAPVAAGPGGLTLFLGLLLGVCAAGLVAAGVVVLLAFAALVVERSLRILVAMDRHRSSPS